MISTDTNLVQMLQTSFPWPDAPEEDKYSVCVHCGFCLEVCPTYQQLGDENHSPRGRVYLIKEASMGHLPLDEAVINPVFTCLDCRACETVCPSGVQVGTLIEQARGQVHYAEPPSGVKGTVEKLFLRKIFPRPKRLQQIRRLMRFYQRSGFQTFVHKTKLLGLMPKHLAEMEAVIPAISERSALESLPERMTSQDGYGVQCEPGTKGVRGEDGPHGVRSEYGQPSQRKGTAALFTGCVMDVFFSDINQATARVALKNGLDVVVPRDQICCGALQVHAGDRDQARAMARRNIDVFEQSGADYIIINAAGCGAALKEYPELFKDDAQYHEKAEAFSRRVKDISELLVEVGFEPPTGEVPCTVTYHDACHLCHAQKIRSQPRELLRSIPGLKLIEMADSERCCGSAGIYNLLHPEMAGELLERKMDDIPEDVEAVVMGNPGCMMQIKVGVHRRKANVDVLHTVELLDLAYQRERAKPMGRGSK